MGLKTYADAVLANVNAVFAAAAPPVVLPTLQYVAPGPYSSISFDCDQLVVSIDQLTRGRPGEPQSSYTRLPLEWSATVTVSIIRLCMPTSGTTAPPLAIHQAAASEITMRDLDLLWRNVKAILDVEGCTHHGVVLASLIEIQGAAGGARLVSTVDLLMV